MFMFRINKRSAFFWIFRLVCPDDAKVGVYGEGKETLSVLRTQYIFINKILFSFIQKMKNKYVLDSLSAAKLLTDMTLGKADDVFYRQRRVMEDHYGLPHGVFSGF